jgi:choline-sulfatase
MTRKEFLTTGPAAMAGLSLKGRAAAQSGKRPKNVLLLMSDQHKHRCLSIEGEPFAKTPNLDALTRSSVRFDSAYCTNPVCTPSRASLLTGLYTHNHRAYTNGTPWPFEHKTIAHHFTRAGYMSALIGKMHFVDAQTHGFDYHLDFNDWFQYMGPKTKLYADELGHPNSGSGLPQIDDLWRDFGDPWKDLREKDDRTTAVAIGRVSKIPEQDHFDSFVARESIRFLKNHAKDQPFFLLSSFLRPHDPFMPSERFAKMFPPQDMKLPDTWGKVDFATVPKEIQKRIEAGKKEMRDADGAKLRTAMYYANLAEMDSALGQVLTALRELGLEDDTIVLYTSDHGEMLGEHGLWHKFVFYEPSVAVPLLFRVPGLTEAGARSKTHVSLTQVLPTLLDLCGLPVPSGLDGGSMVADLRAPTRTRDTAVFSEFNLRNAAAKYMIRRGEYKLNYYVNDMSELFNLKEDPKEMKNLALLPQHKDKVEELKSQLFAWYRPPEKADAKS